MFHIDTKSLFVGDILEDMNRKEQIKEAQQKRDEMLLNASDAKALEEMLKTQPSEFTSVENMFAKEDALLEKEETKVDLHSKVIIAVKNANYDVLERAFDEGIQVDSKDDHGNTLLILACQQGNKKMVKFLLRLGASMNLQNNSGNTCLHYLFQYGHRSLAEYLIRKGADDSFLNADDLTCYEGLRREDVEAI